MFLILYYWYEKQRHPQRNLNDNISGKVMDLSVEKSLQYFKAFQR